MKRTPLALVLALAASLAGACATKEAPRQPETDRRANNTKVLTLQGYNVIALKKSYALPDGVYRDLYSVVKKEDDKHLYVAQVLGNAEAVKIEAVQDQGVRTETLKP